MPSKPHLCTLWRDRRLLDPKRIADFCTGLDPEDDATLEGALAASASRDPRYHGDLAPYSLDVRAPENPNHLILSNYRHNPGLYMPEEDTDY